MRVFAAVQRMSRPLWANTIIRGFSEMAAGNGNAPKAYEDWQYCKMISQQLKNNSINNALSLLFQSYFNQKVLDIQIYNQIQQKIIANNLPLSYAQILYSVYRQHFPPHALISNWMNKLTLSKSDDFIQKLKKDFELLGQPFPLRTSRAAKRQAKKQLKSQKVETLVIDEGTPNPPKKAKANKIYTQSVTTVQLPNIDVPKFQGDMTPQQLYRSKITAEVKNALSQLSVDTSQFSRIVVHDIDVEFGNHDEFQGEELPSDQEEQFGEQDMQNMGLLGFDISKIKIGKIQFFNDNRKDQ